MAPRVYGLASAKMPDGIRQRGPCVDGTSRPPTTFENGTQTASTRRVVPKTYYVKFKGYQAVAR
jgi:hypothetical protein